MSNGALAKRKAPRPAHPARGRDREFLPAALEILETPPSPVKMSLLKTLCGFVAVAILWASFSRIDVIAVAQGKLQPTGRTKVIQPLETGRVATVKVENGTRVHAGDVLVELDAAENAADAAQLTVDLAAFRAETLRREAAIAAARTRKPDAAAVAAWPDTIPVDIRQHEEHVLAADMLQLDAQVESLKAQIDQKRAEQDRLTKMIAAEETLIGTIRERVTMRQALMATNAGSKSGLIEALEALQTQQTTLAQQEGQRVEAEASIQVSSREIDRTYRTFIADNAQKLVDAERQASDNAERLKKAEARLEHQTLRSPIDGTVTSSTIVGPGQVVTSGQDVMRIVSDKDALEVECYLLNRDVGFVQPGDHAVLKIESFPFTRYGTVNATVTRIARDAIPEPDADAIEKDGSRQLRAQTDAGGQRTQNLVFAVTLRPERATIGVDGVQVPLSAGMAVTAEIRTGSRRVIEYIFSPLVKVASESMKER